MEVKEPFFGKETFTKENTSSRGQAAIFDGITFLLLVSASVALMFAFLGEYGTAEAKVLRSSHTLNYVQSIGKTIYYLDASLLANAEDCNELQAFTSNSVADLIKRDISDSSFDDRFGESEEANSPGKTALRCGLNELMKPVLGAGFDYHAEILSADRVDFGPFPPTANSPELITSLPAGDRLYEVAKGTVGGEFGAGGCDSISRALKEKQLLAIATPFRVLDTAGGQHDHQLRICMWPSERR